MFLAVLIVVIFVSIKTVDGKEGPPISDEEKRIGSMLPITAPTHKIPWGRRPSKSRGSSRLYVDGSRWPNGRIPYTISDSFNDNHRRVIAQAMEHIEVRSCVTFVHRTSSDSAYVSIESKSDDCFSYVGRKPEGGVQVCNLGLRGCMNFGTVVHELLHSCGADHEQNRPDRDEYVKINWKNILPNMTFNLFRDASSLGPKEPICPEYPNVSPDGTYDNCVSGRGGYTTYGLPYEYNSIMHYGSKDFAADAHFETMIPKKPNVSTMGNNYRMTRLDVAKLSNAYGCTLSDCMKSQSGSSGTVEWPSNATRQICEWNLKATDRHLVKIRFDTFQFSDCQDYVSIIDDVANATMGPFCSTKPATPSWSYISMSDSLRVIVKKTNQANVFKASWVAYVV